MNEVAILREAILFEAYDREILTAEEYVQCYKDKYLGPFPGNDAFFGYLSAVLTAPGSIFLTMNEQMKKDGDMLLDRFGVVVM